jgi:hypothetical protein
MNTTPAPEALAASLRRVHRGVLATLAVCAVVIAASAQSGAGAPPRAFPIAAVALALGAIFARQAAATATPRRRVHLTLASLLLSGCIGLVGVALALQGGARGVALAYVLGAAILCLRPSPPVRTR